MFPTELSGEFESNKPTYAVPEDSERFVRKPLKHFRQFFDQGVKRREGWFAKPGFPTGRLNCADFDFRWQKI